MANKIPLGKVAFTDAGKYNSGSTYGRFDFVDTDDSCYLSLKDNNKGHAVTETDWWKCLARGTSATQAAKIANEAAALANEKAQAAETAASNATSAITKANAAASSAQQQAQAAETAADEAAKIVSDVNAALDELKELEDTLVAKDRKQPTSMTVEFPAKITQGNKSEKRIKASLSPAGTGSNILFLGDEKAVSVAPDGFITVKEAGKSRIYVIPTENTSIYQTIEIEVVAQSLRLNTSSSLRKLGNGNLRFN